MGEPLKGKWVKDNTGYNTIRNFSKGEVFFQVRSAVEWLKSEMVKGYYNGFRLIDLAKLIDDAFHDVMKERDKP